MKDTLERAIEAAIRAGATPSELASMIRQLAGGRAHEWTEPAPGPDRLQWFQQRVAEVVAKAPETIKVPFRGGEIQLHRQIEHSIATETITLAYRLAGTPIMVREVMDASEVPEVIPETVQSLVKSAAQVIECAMRGERSPTPRQQPFFMDETCPHADV